jgi:ASC-1-like (ASCH) protein
MANTTTAHSMRLKTTPFTMIVRGEKTVESRIFDEKRQKVQLGDLITFTCIDDSAKTITTRVVGLLRYETFEAMFTRNDPRKFGGNSVAELMVAVKKYYSLEEQTENGVLGIEIQTV